MDVNQCAPTTGQHNLHVWGAWADAVAGRQRAGAGDKGKAGGFTCTGAVSVLYHGVLMGLAYSGGATTSLSMT